MISMLALIGGITGMFVLFGVAWKLLEPTLGWEALAEEGGPGPAIQDGWHNEPTPDRDSGPPLASGPSSSLPPVWTPIPQSTVAYAVPPPLPSPPAHARGRTMTLATPPPPPPPRPPPLPAAAVPPIEDDEGAATQFFDRATLAEFEAQIDRTAILGDQHIIEFDARSRGS